MRNSPVSTATPRNGEGSPESSLESLRRPDRYHVLSVLGEGAVGLVERVFDAHLGRIVARKTLRESLRSDHLTIRTFVNEAKIIGHLDHGSVVPIFDAYVNEEGLPVYTMREIRGRSLARVLKVDFESGNATPLALDRTLKIVSQLCEGLAHAHERGVLHLDLKPQNIIVLEHDEVVLVDWGAARLFSPERYFGKLEKFPELSLLAKLEPEDDELFVGTPRYMSPEQTEKARADLGPSSDIFSMGIIFYQMLTGGLPFHGESLEELLFHIRETPVEEPRKVDSGIHRRLSSIVMRMLAKSPADRYQGFEEVLGDLEEFRSTAAEFPVRHFEAGELIFSEGDPGDAAYVIVEGEVEIWTGTGEARRALGLNVEGEVFGELALLRDMPRSASATARQATSVRVIGQPSLMSEVERLNPWVLAILSGVVERFVDRSERLVELLRQSDDD